MAKMKNIINSKCSIKIVDINTGKIVFDNNKTNKKIENEGLTVSIENLSTVKTEDIKRFAVESIYPIYKN